MPDAPFSTIPEILDELRAGRMVVVTDDEHRENEGDLILPAEFMTPEAVMFMLKEATGYMFVSLTEADCDRVDLHGQAPVNTSARGTPLTVSVDGHPKHGFTTGVSAHERARTIRMLIDPGTGPDDFVRPGHINPLRSRDGGVLVRTGHTEGIVDLCRLAGLTPACVGIEIVHPEGRMARLPDLAEFCAKHTLKMCSIKQIIEHRLTRSTIVERIEPLAGTTVRTPEGAFNLIAFRTLVDPLPHLALTVGGVGDLTPGGGPIETADPTLVRVHRRDLLGDIFGDLESGSAAGSSTGDTLRAAMRMIQREGRGAIVYLRPSGTGDGLSQRLTRPHGTSDEDRPGGSIGAAMLEYGVGSQILRGLGLRSLRVITSGTTEYPQLGAFGLEITERVSPEPGE
ncbi:MAG: riboflavin biosynthesis protein RibBA [Phycisphaeraceae bacterium]|nr:MAG: riboflavin biosynthesis protein RibBA [Phycisphaeraceae bacterium]